MDIENKERKVCLIGKYPPIQGGISKNNYWLARWLAKKGYEVYVITNAFEVEEEYRIYLEGDDLEMLKPDFSQEGKGKVNVWSSNPFSNFSYIPFSRPYVSLLSGMAIQEIERNKIDLIYSSYLEPYGVAGYIASISTGKPHIVSHAGSDFYKLRKDTSLGTVYRVVYRSAHCIITSIEEISILRKWGISDERFYTEPIAFPLPTSHFNPDIEPLDINAFFRRMNNYDKPYLNTVLKWHSKEFDDKVPTIGIYGKVSEKKGSYKLVDALSILKKKGIEFNFLAMSGGRQIEKFKSYVIERGLRENTWFIPFLPHWKVPSFIRACLAVCFLEHNFWFSLHYSGIPKEIMACGTCLITSGEIERKQFNEDVYQEGENYIGVKNPGDVNLLAQKLQYVIENPNRAKEIGMKGFKIIRNTLNSSDEIVKSFEQIFTQALRVNNLRK